MSFKQTGIGNHDTSNPNALKLIFDEFFMEAHFDVEYIRTLLIYLSM